MKKIKFLFLTFAAFGLLLGACTQDQGDLGTKFKEPVKVAVDLQITKPDLQTTKAGGLDGDNEDVMYCDTELLQDGYVSITYSVSFWDENDDPATQDDGQGGQVNVPDINNKTEGYSYTGANLQLDAETGSIATISRLISLDFVGNTDHAIISVEDFKVWDKEPTFDTNNEVDNGAIILFITPRANSAYADYVTTPVTYGDIKVDLYEKQYVNIDVLCFNEEEIPKFGFTWFDFNIVTGDEICLFFNCMGYTAATYHQVFAGEFFAYHKIVENPEATSPEMIWSEEAYWSSDNYTPGEGNDNLTDIKPFCVPCPGNWKTEGMLLEVFPAWDPNTSFKFEITPEMIAKFLDDDPSLTWPSLTELQALTESGYGSEVVDEVVLEVVDNTPFIHFTLADCFKPKAFYNDYLELGGNGNPLNLASITGESKVFAINYDLAGDVLSNFSVDYAFSVEGMVHSAMTPDQSRLIFVHQRADRTSTIDPAKVRQGAAFSYFDIYTLEQTWLTPKGDFRDLNMENGYEPEVDKYDFNELLYVDGQLYAGCSSFHCLTRVEIDWDAGTFEYKADYIDMNKEIVLNGGDLVSCVSGDASDDGNLVSISKNGSGEPRLLRYLIDPATDALTFERWYSVENASGVAPEGLVGVTASSMVGAFNNGSTDISGMLTATNDTGTKGFYYFNSTVKDGTLLVPMIDLGNSGMTATDFMHFGGDMASPYNVYASESNTFKWSVFRSFFTDVTLEDPTPSTP